MAAGSGRQSAVDMGAVWGAERVDSLVRHDAVAEGGELFRQREFEFGVCHPSVRQTHQPFYEAGRGTVLSVIVQEGGCGGSAPGEVFPSSNSQGVASPASKNCSISGHSSSGSCCWRESGGPFSAKSMT